MPNPSVFRKDVDSFYTLTCDVCGIPTVIIGISKVGIGIATSLRSIFYYVHSGKDDSGYLTPSELERATALLTIPDYKGLDSLISKFHIGGIPFYCPECNVCYCPAHLKGEDYRIRACPKGHEGVVCD